MRARWVVVLGCVLSACSGGSSTPTSPTPAPTVATLTFAGETTTPASFSFWLDVQPESTPGQVAIAVKANATARFAKFRGTLIFDKAVLAVVNYTEGDFMKQDGAITTTSVTNAGGNSVVMRIDRPDSLAGVSGSGTVLVVRFKPATDVRSGRSALQWDDAHAYTSSFSETLLRTYAGTITVQ